MKPQSYAGLKVLAVVVAVAVVFLLAFRALSIAGAPGGTCMIKLQPDIVIGAAPSFTTELDCAP